MQFFNRAVVLSACGVMLLFAVAQARAATSTVVFSTDFEVVPSEFTFSGFQQETIETTTGADNDFVDYGFSGTQWIRTTGTNGGTHIAMLTLSDLPDHTSIDLNFLFGSMDSHDGSGAGDGLEVQVDGTTVYQSYYGGGGNGGPSEALIVKGVQLGYHTGTDTWWTDGAYDMGLASVFNNIAHTGSTLEILFIATHDQGAGDESFAVDDVEVVLHGVPEPASLGLLGIGAVMLVRRRRK